MLRKKLFVFTISISLSFGIPCQTFSQGQPILHNITDGNFDNLPGNINYISSVNEEMQGWWGAYAGWAGSSIAEVVSDGNGGAELKLSQNWMGQVALAFYEDYLTTPTNTPWQISCRMKAEYTNNQRKDAFKLLNDLGETVFEMIFHGNIGNGASTIDWKAGNTTGASYNISEINNVYKTIKFEYDPRTGDARGIAGDVIVFSVKTEPDLQIKRVHVENRTDNNTWDPGVLYVDDFKATALPTARIMHGISQGNADKIPSNLNGIVTVGQEPQGFWSSYINGSAPSTYGKITNDISNNVIELTQGWFPQEASAWYTDYLTTPLDQAFRISAKMKGTYTNQTRSDVFELLDNTGKVIFKMSVSGSDVQWQAGDLTDIKPNIFKMSNEFSEFSIEYSPITGETNGRIGNIEVFNVLTNYGLSVKTVKFRNISNQWDPGSLYIDDIKATAINYLEEIKRGIATPLNLETTINLSSKINELKNRYGVNQLRLYMAPKYENTGLEWWTKGTIDRRITQLPGVFNAAKANEIDVVINVHQTNHLHSDNDYLGDTRVELLRYWENISSISKEYPNQRIWLEIFNEPGPSTGSFPHPPPENWLNLAQDLIMKIREFDLTHPIVVPSGPGTGEHGFHYMTEPLHDPENRTIYTFHQWDPAAYSHHGKNGHSSEIRWGETMYNETFDINYIRNICKHATKFSNDFNQKMWIGEFGASPYLEDYKNPDAYLKDNIDLFEQNKWGWSYWSDDPGFWGIEKQTLKSQQVIYEGFRKNSQLRIIADNNPIIVDYNLLKNSSIQLKCNKFISAENGGGYIDVTALANYEIFRTNSESIWDNTIWEITPENMTISNGLLTVGNVSGDYIVRATYLGKKHSYHFTIN